MKTSSVEVAMIVNKANDYDRIYKKQLDLEDRVDSILNLANKLDIADTKVSYNSTATVYNARELQNSLRVKRTRFTSELNDLPEKDYFLYKRLSKQIGVFFSTKDSVLQVKAAADAKEEDLTKCQEKQKMIKRSVRGLLY
jgi:hypothetical protein